MIYRTCWIWVCIVIGFWPGTTIAQYPCHGSSAQAILNANYIHAGFHPRGTKFFDGETTTYLAPFPKSWQHSALYASAPWIGGFDDAGNLKQAIETYYSPTTGDFSVGPLNSIGLGYDGVCDQFDRVWMVYAEDILRHRIDFDSDGKIDDTLSVIFGWPATGNAFFSRYNGFEFPDITTVGRGDFMDMNTNGRYEPDKGDFPVARFQGRPIIPDQLLLTIFNDVDMQDTLGLPPIRFEVQLSAFAMFCQDNPMLNHTIFNVYKLTNRAVTPLDSVFFGMWNDYDLGCSADDLIGCDSARSAEFVYNFDPVDGDAGEFCTTGAPSYPGTPPVQSMTYLSHPMHSFITHDIMTGTHLLSPYRTLTGTWPDGLPMVAEGEGYVPGSIAPPTRYLFHGDPRDPTAWSALREREEGQDYKTVSSVSMGRFDPGQQKSVELAYTFHHQPDADHLDQLTKMYADIDSLRTWAANLEEVCSVFPVCLGDACVWPGDFNQDGIVNHLDMLEWGVMNDASGPDRDRRIHWRGYSAQDWDNTTALDINYKHGDGNGDGIVNIGDLAVNAYNFLKRKENVTDLPAYPLGEELIISADPMEATGRIRNIKIRTAGALTNVYGLTFELEFDTLLYKNTSFPNFFHFPADTGLVTYLEGQYLEGSANSARSNLYAFVGTNHTPYTIAQDETLLNVFSGLILNNQVSVDDLPDTVVLRLKNIRAIDVEGNRLAIGSTSLKVPKAGITSVIDPRYMEVRIYPVPSTGTITIESMQPDQGLIYTVHGEVLRLVHLGAGIQQLNLEELPSGIYFLRMVRTGQIGKIVLTGSR